jgi:hypothetical protein
MSASNIDGPDKCPLGTKSHHPLDLKGFLVHPLDTHEVKCQMGPDG